MEKFNAHVEEQTDAYVEALRRLCRQPSIAAQGAGIAETAQIVRSWMEEAGFETQVIPVNGGSPVVWGEVGEGPRTLTFYDHYDVQPADPLDQWESDPFAAEIRDGYIYARGVADNKGDLAARIAAIQAWQESLGPFPLRVKFFVEGEEEVGSPHLESFAQERRELLDADGMVWEGSYKDSSGRPVLYLGVKGLAYFELRSSGPSHDLHSSWGTLIPNPAWRLVHALATLRDVDDNLLLDGLWDHVAEPPEEDLDMLKKVPFEEEKLKRDFGVSAFAGGVTGLAAAVRHFFHPTTTICGFRSGYIEDGVKTVLPATAMAKLGIRLVPNLTYELVEDLLNKHLERRGFGDVEIVRLSAENPAKSDPHSAVARAAADACRTVYGEEPVVYPIMAGTGPMYPLSTMLGIPVVSGMGVGHAQSRIHSPNENISVEDFIQGIKYTGELIRRFAELA